MKANAYLDSKITMGMKYSATDNNLRHYQHSQPLSHP